MTSLSALSLVMWLPLVAAPLPHESSDLPADERILWGSLDNGLTYAIMQNAEPPERVSLRLLVRAGSLQETEEERGLAHFLEHLAFNGSENYPPGELIEYLQRIGMGFGADTNAHTSFDETVYKLELPGTTDALLNEGFQVLSDYAGGLLLLEDEVDRERGVVLSELRDRETVDYRTFVAYWEFLFPETLMPQRLPIGLREVIEQADAEAFRQFYTTWYRPDNMAVVVVGDIDPAAIEPLLRQAFSGLSNPSERMPEIDLGTIPPVTLKTKLHSEPEATKTEIGLMTIRPYTMGQDSRAQRIEAIQTAAANRMLSRRLEILAKEEGAPFTSGSTYTYDYLDFFELAGVEIETSDTDWQPALEVAEQQLRRALEYGFTEAEVAEAKANLLKGYELAVDKASTRRHRALSASITRSLSHGDVFTAPELDLELAREAMKDYGPQEALAALRQLWRDPGRYLFVSGNLQLAQGEEALTAAYLASQAVAVEPPVQSAAKAWPYTDFGPSGKVVKQSEHDDLAITQVVFDNNVRFNFKQTDYEAGTVKVLVRFGGGRLSVPEGDYGLASFASSTFGMGGTQQLSMDEITQVLAGVQAQVNFAVGEDAFVFSGSTTPEDFARQMEVITAYLKEPGYRQEAARQARKFYATFFKELEQTLEGVMSDQVRRYLSSGSRFFGYPDDAQFDRYTMQDVKAWLADPLANAYMEVSVVGDIDYDSALEQVASTFGALPKRADAPREFKAERSSVAFPQGGEKTFVYPTNLPRAAAAVYWPTTDYWDIQQTRRLGMLARILGDRLRVEVREKLGEGYSPYARNISSEIFNGYGYMFALNLCDPEGAAAMASMLQDLGLGLGQGNVTEDELSRALQPLLKQLDAYVRTNDYWLGRVLQQSQAKPQMLDWARTLKSDYAVITVEEINTLAKNYLGQGKQKLVMVIPEET
ncbi:MAG: insulinase family protein [Verrucomicrobiota bacterium]